MEAGAMVGSPAASACGRQVPAQNQGTILGRRLPAIEGRIDTTSSTGRLVFGIFAALAEFERDPILERTMAGLAAARARGRAGGRPRLMTCAKLRTAMAMMAERR